jgi:hypothetical protein
VSPEGKISAPSAPGPEDEPIVLEEWSARRISPLVVLSVASIYGAFLALAYFVFHSTGAVKGLALAAVGTLVPLLPALTRRIEYRITETGLESRPRRRENPDAFREVFRWDQLSHVVPGRRGFKFTKPNPGSNPLRRFWNAHFSDAFSGEVHLEAEDRERVLRLVETRAATRGTPTGKA